ncbi:MAG: MAPEG family protein [Pseudomonadota bacterium]
MTNELMWLTWAVVLNAIMWVPYILNMIMVRGLVDAVGYSTDPKPLAPWAERMKKAHYNGVENLVIFGAAVLIANAAGVTNETTVLAAQVYVWARVVHVVAYTAGIPWVRTLAFAVSWLCTVAILLQLI